jgi:hypothetical protein
MVRKSCGKKAIGLKVACAMAAALDLNPFDLVELSAKEIKQIQEIKKRAAKFAEQLSISVLR